MGKRLKNGTMIFENKPNICFGESIVGKKESEGPLGNYFKNVMKNENFNEKTYEKTEKKMISFVINELINDAKMPKKDIDVIIGGDLMNQIISVSFSAREFNSQLLGLYGACSTMCESLILGASLIDSGFVSNAVCVTGTHFGSVERQYRFPLDLGTQRPPSSQWTVTGAGGTLLKNSGGFCKITKGLIGKVIDYGVTDANNMGAAMSPSARDTLVRFFEDTSTTANDYDLIVTGDLGRLGSEILYDLMKEKGYDISSNHFDCGGNIYNEDKSRFQGGSGAGCSASVFNSVILEKIKCGELKKVIFMATGALLSPLSVQQGESIPGISHLVCVEV